MEHLRVGGLVPLTSIDYPGALSAVLFCQGCPWRCGYCHNPHLLPRHGPDAMPWAQVRPFLERRRGLLDAVVFSGGEPTLQRGLVDALREVRDMGFRVGLHTAGPYPERLAAVLPLADWVAMDIKAPFARYSEITGVPGSGEKARESAQQLLASGVAHEFRTTADPRILDDDALTATMHALAELGVRRYALQGCRSQPHQPAAGATPHPNTLEKAAALFPEFEFRPG